MKIIKLRVTQRALDHQQAGTPGERQIAFRTVSPELQATISQITAHSRAIIRLGGCVRLIVGDRGAIWRAHNADYAADFDGLYDLLARRPDVEMQFLCEID